VERLCTIGGRAGRLARCGSSTTSAGVPLSRNGTLFLTGLNHRSSAAAKETAQQLEAAGLDVGIRPVPHVDIQCANAFFDPEPSRIALGLTSGGLDEAIREQVEMCPI